MSNFKDCRTVLASMGITLRRNEYREYEVYPRRKRALAYYTNDLADAFASGGIMASQFQEVNHG